MYRWATIAIIVKPFSDIAGSASKYRVVVAMLLENLRTREAENAFRTHGVKVAYLFGSYAKGTALPTSDVDIAVLFDEAIDKNRDFELLAGLTAELMKLLERNDIDVVALNNASPLLRYKVFTDGEVIFSDSEKGRVRFEVKAMRDYFDTKRLREIMRKAYVDRSA
ncbi:MAG TPA: nucleotidyltransferase domain-containing protein [Anaerolineae bacterium]|jgi:predicted nucleotidyltransferase|nr:nucleotidyltransferase domain-containing protein [Anaerolineae bacterium]